VKGWGVREESVLEDEVVVVEAVDGIEDGADDGDGIVFNKLAPCEDVLASSNEKQYFV